MSQLLQPALTSITKLNEAISRMINLHGFSPLSTNHLDGTFSSGRHLVLLTQDPLLSPESLDACVILPEALKRRPSDIIVKWVADAETSQQLMASCQINRAPAVIFFQNGQITNYLEGIRDWGSYEASILALVDSCADRFEA